MEYHLEIDNQDLMDIKALQPQIKDTKPKQKPLVYYEQINQGPIIYQEPKRKKTKQRLQLH